MTALFFHTLFSKYYRFCPVIWQFLFLNILTILYYVNESNEFNNSHLQTHLYTTTISAYTHNWQCVQSRHAFYKMHSQKGKKKKKACTVCTQWVMFLSYTHGHTSIPPVCLNIYIYIFWPPYKQYILTCSYWKWIWYQKYIQMTLSVHSLQVLRIHRLFPGEQSQSSVWN